jgi:hypothetical protein
VTDPSSRFERHRRKMAFVLVAASALLTDLVFTRAYRWLRPDEPSGPAGFRVKSDVYHHGFRPLASVEKEQWGPWVSAYRINSLGFRDRTARQVALRSEKARILFIGDSFTEGVGVPYEQSFVGRVDQALAPRGVEVLGAGVASYSPIMYYRRVRHLFEDVGLGFDALVVYLDIGDIEDEVTYKLDTDGNVVSRPERRVRELSADRHYEFRGFERFPGLKQFLYRNSLLGWSLFGWLENRFRNPWHRAGLWTDDEGLFEAYGREGLQRAEENMDRLLGECRKHGVRLTLAVYPWPDQIRSGNLESRQVVYWRGWTEKNSVGFLNYFPRFVDPKRGKEILETEFIRGDIHWNEAGHRAIAEGFLHYFDEGGVLPQPASAAAQPQGCGVAATAAAASTKPCPESKS